MPNLYAAYLGSAVRERVEAMQERAQELLSLEHETAIMQELAGQAIRTYQQMNEQADKSADMMLAQRLRMGAMDIVISALNQVRDMKVAANRIRSNVRTIDIAQLHNLSVLTMNILEEELNKNQGLLTKYPAELLDSIAGKLHSALMIADSTAVTTNLTAERLDREVREMIESVPMYRETRESKAG